MTEVVEIATRELVTETETDTTRIAVRLVGSAEGTSITNDINVYIAYIHRIAVEREVLEVLVDVRALDFISASCVRALLGWLHDARLARYGVRFLGDSRRHWQTRTLPLLVAGERVKVDLI